MISKTQSIYFKHCDIYVVVTRCPERCHTYIHIYIHIISWKSVTNDEDVSDAVNDNGAESWTHRYGHTVGMRIAEVRSGHTYIHTYTLMNIMLMTFGPSTIFTICFDKTKSE